MSSPKARRKLAQALVKARRKGRASAASCRCGKVRFPSEHAAMNALLSGRSGHRVYRCEHGGWHTTSKRFRGVA